MRKISFWVYIAALVMGVYVLGALESGVEFGRFQETPYCKEYGPINCDQVGYQKRITAAQGTLHNGSLGFCRMEFCDLVKPAQPPQESITARTIEFSNCFRPDLSLYPENSPYRSYKILCEGGIGSAVNRICFAPDCSGTYIIPNTDSFADAGWETLRIVSAEGYSDHGINIRINSPSGNTTVINLRTESISLTRLNGKPAFFIPRLQEPYAGAYSTYIRYAEADQMWLA